MNMIPLLFSIIAIVLASSCFVVILCHVKQLEERLKMQIEKDNNNAYIISRLQAILGLIYRYEEDVMDENPIRADEKLTKAKNEIRRLIETLH